ncbi:unnamed protein product [Tuber aestivum]|uniref:Uncharacterized protein n=1 Tax=Tuber aestivum TaxID=59557 RepID=A0A292PNJ5_9PEZI|nr:unnamed protein product [Tuber aestivum]
MLLSLRSRSLLLPPFSGHVGPIRKLASSTRKLATTSFIPTPLEMKTGFHEYKEDLGNFVNDIAGTLETYRGVGEFDGPDPDPRNKQLEMQCKENLEILRDLRFNLLTERAEKMRFKGEFNILGALEFIVYSARLNKRITSSAGVQKGLIELAGKEEFIKIVQQEVQDRGLNLEDVIACVPGIYDEVSNRPHDNYSKIVLWAREYTPNQVAALVGFLKMQSKWPHALDWREDRNRDSWDACLCCPPKPKSTK